MSTFTKKELNQRIDARNKELKTAQEQRPDHEFGWDVYAYRRGAKAELLARLNAWVRWIDPGEPVNWRGL